MAPPNQPASNNQSESTYSVEASQAALVAAQSKEANNFGASEGRATPQQENPPQMSEVGVSGLWQFSGYTNEERLLQLQGIRGQKIFRQMSENDPTIGAFLYAIEFLLRNVAVRVEPASDSPEDIEYAEFVTSCMGDMSHTFESTISEILSMCVFGWSGLEIVYKRRLGPEGDDPTTRSNYDDGYIGWRKLPIRSQESLQRWQFDNDGGVQGWWQQPPQGGPLLFIPINKALLFRTTSKKNNPEGFSLLRRAYTAWYRKSNMERIEAIGVERELSGLPVLYVPKEMLAADADANTKAVLETYKRIVRNIRNDEQQGLVLPTELDEQGKKLLELTLLSSSSRRSIDTSAIITRYAKEILTCVLADVLTLGQGAVGSFALASSKTNLFSFALGSILDELVAPFNRYAIPRLFRVNAFPTKVFPKLVHGDLEKMDMSVVATAVLQFVQAGGITPGGKEDEEFFRELVGMPKKVGSEQEKANPQAVPVPGQPPIPDQPPTPQQQAVVQATMKMLKKFFKLKG